MPATRFGSVFRHAAKLLPRSVAGRLYAVGALTLGTICVLALSMLIYVERTTRVVTEIRDHDVMLSATSADIELMLERHRRIVEVAPVQIDIVAVERDRAMSEQLADRIAELVRTAKDPLLDPVKKLQDELVLSGRRVLYLAANSAQSEALDEVKIYHEMANSMQDAVRLSRAGSIARTERRVTDLVERGEKLRKWATAAAALALLFVMPLSVFIISSVALRIKSITDVMRRVALNDHRVAISSIGARDEIGEMARALEIFKRNAAELMTNSQELEKLNAWFHIALNNMARGLSMFDANGKLLVCNAQYLELYGLPTKMGAPGTSFESIAEHWCAKHDQSGTKLPADVAGWMANLRQQLKSGIAFSQVHDIDCGRTALVITQPLEGGGWVDLHEDITEKLAAENEISRLAHLDTLTGLANRHYFQETLEEALNGLLSGTRFAVLWFDLDKFKAVNDTLGHPTGDALLQIVAERLRKTVRGSDFVARLGGDEFAIIATGADFSEHDASTLANRLLRKISEPYDIGGKIVSVGVSIGIAIAPAHGCTAEDLTRNADIALYRAKSRGRGNFVTFNDNLGAEISVREQAETDLRLATCARVRPTVAALSADPRHQDRASKIVRSPDALATPRARHGLTGGIYSTR